MEKLLILAILFMFACKSNSQQTDSGSQTEKVFEISKTDAEWKSILNEMEYYIIREKGTERPGTGDLLDNKAQGTYTCRACDLELFSSETKFESGTGWPSFFDPISQKNIYTETDYHVGYPRTEIMCNRCGGHLGHVFDDGPQPTGKRYCLNAASLDFEEKPKPE